MKCAAIEVLLCDYVDGTLAQSGRAAVDAHVDTCAGCQEMLEDSRAAVAFLAAAPEPEAPPELITSILYRTQTEARPRAEERARRGWFARLFQPILQPRFAMGMAMTILSFSMIGRMAGIPQRPLTAADLEPARIWSSIDQRAHRAYDRLVKYVDNLRLVYEIQHRLGEWSAQDEQAAAAQGRKRRQVETPGGLPAVGPDEQQQQQQQQQRESGK